MIKVNSLVVKIAGVLLAILGIFVLLLGVLMGFNKQVLATGFIACIIAVTLLYYGWKLPPEKRESSPTDAGAGSKQKI